MRVGMIGLGHMGAGMAKHIRAAGFVLSTTRGARRWRRSNWSCFTRPVRAPGINLAGAAGFISTHPDA